MSENHPDFDRPYGDPYWDMQALLEGKKVVGHKMTPEELYTFSRTLYCFSSGWVEQDGIIWRYYAE